MGVVGVPPAGGRDLKEGGAKNAEKNEHGGFDV